MNPDLEHAGILSSDDIPEDSLLGYLIGLVHHQFILDQEVLEKIMKKAKLPEEYWPNKPKAIPSFQAACRSMEDPRFEEMTFKDPETRLDIIFRVEYVVDTLSDGSRQLTRKINYPENAEASPELKRILDIHLATTQKEPEKMAKFQYDPKSDTIIRKNLYGEFDELAIIEQTDKKYAKALEQFNRLKHCYTERYLKDAWFRMLRTTGGIPWLKNCGSLWFVPHDAKKAVEAYGAVYQKIHGNSSTWRTVPIINTEQHRKYLSEDVQEEFKDRYKAFLTNVAKKIESERDPEKVKDLVIKNKDVFEESLKKELVERYNKLLGMSISAKVNDIKLDFDSSRLDKAKMYLRDL